jgi:hypothetical protein
MIKGDARCSMPERMPSIQHLLLTPLYPISARFVGGDWIKWSRDLTVKSCEVENPLRISLLIKGLSQR